MTNQFKTIFYCLIVVLSLNSSAQTINILAGNGTGGYFGDGGAASMATLSSPRAIYVDSLTNDIYFSDCGNNVVRKITYSTGIISTIAGNGTSGFSGDSSLATSAELNGPQGVSKDAFGNIYVVDGYNNRIRKIDSAGIITTIAGTGIYGYSGDGGPAINADLKHPFGIFIRENGDIYFSDCVNQRIRKIDPSTGLITTVVGNGMTGYSGDGGLATNAVLNFPVALFVTKNGNIYIGDGNNYRIREVDASSGIINTIAGTGLGGYFGDGGPATSAQIMEANGIFVDSNGNIFFSDSNNNRIREIDGSTGIVSTIAGNGVVGLSMSNACPLASCLNHPSGIFLNKWGNIFMTDDGNTVRKIVQATAGADTTVCLGSSFILNGEGGFGAGSYSWSPSTYLSSDTSAHPTITPLSTITYTLYVTNGYCNSAPEVTITVDVCAGIAELDFISTSIFPNPFTEQTTITFAEEQKSTSIKIFDIIGNEIESMTFSGKQVSINRNKMSAGVYLLQVIDVNKKVANRRIIVQ